MVESQEVLPRLKQGDEIKALHEIGVVSTWGGSNPAPIHLVRLGTAFKIEVWAIGGNPI